MQNNKTHPPKEIRNLPVNVISKPEGQHAASALPGIQSRWRNTESWTVRYVSHLLHHLFRSATNHTLYENPLVRSIEGKTGSGSQQCQPFKEATLHILGFQLPSVCWMSLYACTRSAKSCLPQKVLSLKAPSVAFTSWLYYITASHFT